MPVVQRLPSPFRLADPATAHVRSTSDIKVERAAMKPDADLACSGLLLTADLSSFAAALTIVSIIWPLAETATASFVSLGCAFAAGSIGFFSAQSHYEQRLPLWAEARDVMLAAGVALLASAAAAFFLELDISRLALFGATLAVPPILLTGRAFARHVLRKTGRWRLPVVVVGPTECARHAADVLGRHARLGYEVVTCDDAPLFGRGWAELLKTHRARLVVLAHDARTGLDPVLVAALVRERIPYALLPDTTSLPVTGMRHVYLGHDAMMVTYRNNLRKPIARAAKTAFDLVAASAALLILAPVLLVIAAVVGLDGGPVLFAHPRVGAKGRVFRCLKFRSMVTDSDAALERLFAQAPEALEEWQRTHKLRHDPRITWIGRFLRKTSLDELPQLLNVLRLDMSLVGPRPIVSLEIPKYSDDIAYYYEARPGITGLWQVSGRSDTTYAQRVRLDSWYVKNWSIWHDLGIIARTVPAVIMGRGAG